MPHCSVPDFCNCHTGSYNKKENWTSFDLCQECLHFFPGRFLGRLPSEKVVLPTVSATAWNWKISFPLYSWKWGAAHRDVPGSRQGEKRRSERCCAGSGGEQCGHRLYGKPELTPSLHVTQPWAVTHSVTLQEPCCRMVPVLLWRTQVPSPAAVQRQHDLPGMWIANKYQFGTAALELTDHYLRIEGWRCSTYPHNMRYP